MQNTLDSYKPRNHIEIERKYFCSSEILGKVKRALMDSGDNGVFTGTESGDFFLDGSFDENGRQIDTYFDTADRLLLSKDITLRIRQLRDRYVCTIKLPVLSKSFGGDSPIARREYELELPLNGETNIDNNLSLIIQHRDFVMERLESVKVKEDEVFTLTESMMSELVPILVIMNDREKGIVKKRDSSFMCEVCLDSVRYKQPLSDATIEDYQVEVELKSDYLTHVIMNSFTSKLEAVMENYCVTEQSKLARGLEKFGTRV